MNFYRRLQGIYRRFYRKIYKRRSKVVFLEVWRWKIDGKRKIMVG